MKREYWIIESRGNKKAWTPQYVRVSAESAQVSLTGLRRFSRRWDKGKPREWRVVVVEGEA